MSPILLSGLSHPASFYSAATEKRNNIRNALVVKARIENPDVILVEEANRCETNALVLDVRRSAAQPSR